MNITYIGHSGYYLELEHCAMLFDYCRGTLPPLDFCKPLYIFASHHHSDHFTPMIFPLFRGHPSVTYILSEDIRQRYNRASLYCMGVTDSEYDPFCFVSPGHHYQIGPLEIDTLSSTDEGVAFIVRTEGLTLYHAGDLNLWLWPQGTVEWNHSMTQRFTSVLEPLRGRHFDVAFLPLDLGQEENFCKGFDYFMRLTDTDNAYPMHFWDDDSIIDRLCALDCTAPYRSKICHAIQSSSRVELFPSYH